LPSNPDDEAQAERGAVSGARPHGQAGRLLLAVSHGNGCISARASAFQHNSARLGLVGHWPNSDMTSTIAPPPGDVTG